jgi:uncharacterized protein YciI
VLYLLRHSPGLRWQAGAGFREQPGIEGHVAYMAEQSDLGRLVLGGPFLDDSGGMMVLRADSFEAARAIAEADPTVADGLLTVEVRPWMVAMSTVAGL